MAITSPTLREDHAADDGSIAVDEDATRESTQARNVDDHATLNANRHGTLGIVFPGVRGPYYAEVIHGFEVAAVSAEMSVLILATELLSRSNSCVIELANRTDGLAIMGGTIDDDLIKRVADMGRPVVTMARSRMDGIHNTRVDNFSSTLALVTHLIQDHGYDHLAFVGNVVGAPDATDRWRGFVQAHHNAGLTPPENPLSSAWEQESGVRAALQILEMRDRPRAVVCGNDEIASGMISSFAASGVLVPHEIAVTGWDNARFSRYSSPPLTTVSQPARALGRQTARMLLSLMDGSETVPEDVVLSTEPIIRRSCGCAFDPMTGFSLKSDPVNRESHTHNFS